MQLLSGPALQKCTLADQAVCGCAKPQRGTCTPNSCIGASEDQLAAGGIGEVFGNPPRGVDAGASCQCGVPAFGETSPALRPWETHPAVSRREGERCPLLESSVSQTPGAEIPPLSWGGSSRRVCQGPAGSAGERTQSPAFPSSPPLGVSPHPAALAGLWCLLG